MRLVKAISRRDRRVMEVGGQVTDITVDRSLDGAPTLTVQLSDPDWSITQSAFLDLDANGRLDHIETQHEQTWYRLVLVNPADNDLTLTFEDRVVGILRQHSKFMKRKRTSGYTRAMFIRDLVKEANRSGHDIGFVCPGLHRQVEIRDVYTGTTSSFARSGDHTGGKRGFTKGVKLHYTDPAGGGPKHTCDSSQLALLELVLSIAHTLKAPRKAQVALVEAMIVESGIHNLHSGDRDSLGILQVRVSTSGSRARSLSPKWSASHFLTGYSRNGVGAIHYANTTNMTTGQIAQKVQVSAFPARYQLHEEEAKAIVAAFHGDAAGADPLSETTTTVSEKAYYYVREKNENSWDCMNRLADEVQWRVFVAENKVFYMSEDDLYRQKPRMFIRRSNRRVTAFAYTWDQGQHMSTMNISLIGDQRPQAGETVEIGESGLGDKRWIVTDTTHARSTGTTDITLGSVSKSLPEPAPETTSKTTTKQIPGSGSGASDAHFQALVQACKTVSKHAAGYIYGAQHERLAKINPSGYFDCSSSVSYVLWKAGLFNSSMAQVSGWIATSWGAYGPGRDFTVWASPEHVFIEFNHTIKRFDTSAWEPGPSGPRVRHSHRPHGGFTPRHFPGM